MIKNDNKIYKEVIQKGLSQRDKIESIVNDILKEDIDNIFLVGCGGSLAVMFPCKYILETNSKAPVYAYNSSEFLSLKPKNLTEKSLVILSSYTGKTPETVKAAEYVNSIGATTIGFTGFKDSPLGKAVKYVFDNHAEAGVTDSKLILLYQIVFNILKHKDNYDKYDEIMNAMDTLPDSLVNIKNNVDDWAKEFAENNKDEKYFMVLGSGILWGETYSYATCILEEMQWILAQPIHAGEYFHGSFEMVREDTNILLFKGEDLTRSLAERAETFSNKYSNKVTVIDTKKYDLPEVPDEFREFLSPFILSAVLDRVSKNLEHARNHPLSTRKYMGIVEY